MISGSEEAVYEAGMRRWVLSTLPLNCGAPNTVVGCAEVYDMSGCERRSNFWGSHQAGEGAMCLAPCLGSRLGRVLGPRASLGVYNGYRGALILRLDGFAGSV